MTWSLHRYPYWHKDIEYSELTLRLTHRVWDGYVRVLSELSGINPFPIMGLALHWIMTLTCSGWLGWTGYLLGYGLGVKLTGNENEAS